jgi:hypothetical protein
MQLRRMAVHETAGVATFVLVHGAMHGGWSWCDVRARLERSGHHVHMLDVEPPATAQRYRELAAADGEGWRVPASPAFLVQWGLTDPGLCAWVAPRLTDFPLRCCTEPMEFDAATLAAVPRTYIRHTDPPLPSLEGSWRRMQADGVEVVDIACGHDMMLANPADTARLLEQVAAGDPSAA